MLKIYGYKEMNMMAKATKKRVTKKVVAKSPARAKSSAADKAGKDRLRDTSKKMAAMKKEAAQRIRHFKSELKHQIAAAKDAAYSKGYDDASKAHQDKQNALEKLVGAVKAKFEKQHAVKSKTKGKAKAQPKAANAARRKPANKTASTSAKKSATRKAVAKPARKSSAKKTSKTSAQ
jgi:hypothetical protein